jgi:pilus assembly protein Flp/PilA
MKHIRRFLRSEVGATAVEYAVMVALILMVAIASIAAVGVNTKSLWNMILNQFTAYGI